MEMIDAAGFGRPQPRPARELRPARIGGTASPAAARSQSAIPVRIVRASAALSDQAADQTGKLGRPQKVLISLMVVGTVVALIGSGSFATFNAATKNAPGITTGVLVLGDKINAASECFSAGGASVSPANNTACTGVWNIATETPGTAISPLQMTIRNAGGIRASALSLYAAGACANSHAGAGYDGTGVICSQVQLEIQQYTDNTFGTPLINTTPTTAAVVAGAAISIPVASSAAFTVNQGISLDTAGNLETSTITAIADATHITATLTKAHASGITVTGSHCWYGSTSGTSCLAEANKLPAACNVSTCTSYAFADAAKTLTNFGTTVTSGSPINVGAVNSGASTYFLVFASLPGNSGDSFQGRRADLTFTWLMVQ
jgi:hypothetical protein